jgi:uncharacterized sulfatase
MPGVAPLAHWMNCQEAHRMPAPNASGTVLICTLFACCLLAPTGDPEPAPNLVVIYVDDMNADIELATVAVPNIDALAQRGVRFLRAYPAHPLCTPSRAAQLSGQYTHHTQIVFNGAVQPSATLNGVPYLPNKLRGAGYHTSGVGKLFHDELPGTWDEYSDFADDPWIVKPVLPHTPDSKNKIIGGPFLNGPDGSLGKIKDTKRTDKALALIQQGRERLDLTGQPFAVWLGLTATHDPFVYPEAYGALYTPDDVPPLPALEQSAWKVAVNKQSWMTPWFFDPQSAPTAEERRIVACLAYYRCISFLDAEIGRVLATLDALDLTGNTVVVLVSDHGWSFGEHSHLGKTRGFDEDMLAPLIVAVPALPEMHGRKVSTPVSQVDLYPTLMDLLGLVEPGPLDGTSLMPLLMDSGATHPPAIYTTDEDYSFNLTRHIVKRDPDSGHVWKLAAWEHDDTIPQVHQLYNLSVDPGEYVNRANDPHVAGLITGLRAELRSVGLLGPSTRNFSVGVPGATGVPALTWTGVPSLGAQGDLHIGNSGGAPALALLVVGLSGSFPGPKSLSVTSLLTTMLVLPADGLDLTLTLPAGSIYDELPIGLQVLQVDPSAAQNMARSRGLAIFLAD